MAESIKKVSKQSKTVLNNPDLHESQVTVIQSKMDVLGHGLEVKKGEVMFLLDKTNQDWWNIRKNNGANGYVPANYVKEIDPKIVSVEVKKPIVVKDVRKVKKTQYIKQKTPLNNQKSGETFAISIVEKKKIVS